MLAELILLALDIFYDRYIDIGNSYYTANESECPRFSTLLIFYCHDCETIKLCFAYCRVEFHSAGDVFLSQSIVNVDLHVYTHHVISRSAMI